MQQFNEPQFLRLIFTLADTEQWVRGLVNATLSQVPRLGKKKLQKNNYYMSASSLAHILERHYHKLGRHPHTGKFCIPVIEILWHIRQAEDCKTEINIGKPGTYRQHNCQSNIGYDQDGNNTSMLTVICDSHGTIITAFPGLLFGAAYYTVNTNENDKAELKETVPMDELIGFA